MLGRETILTVTQQVYDSSLHLTDNRVLLSHTDGKRMLNAYIIYSVNKLTHDEHPTKSDAALAVISLTNTIKIINQHNNLLL